MSLEAFLDMLFKLYKKASVAFSGITIALLGSMFGRAWIRSSLQFMPSAPVNLGLTINEIFDLSCGCGYLIIAGIFLRHHVSPLSKPRGFIVACCLLTVASAMLVFSASHGPTWAGMLFAILAGPSFAYIGVAWSCFYISFGPIRAITYTCIAQMGGELLTFALEGYRTPYLYVVLVILPLISMQCLAVSIRRYSKEISAPIPIRAESSSKSLLWRPALFLASFTFAYSAIDSSVGILGSYPGKFLYLIFPIIMVAWLVFYPKKFSLPLLCKIVMPLMVGSLLFPLAFPNTATNVSPTLVGLCYSASQLVSTFIVALLAHDYQISAPWLVGMVQSAQYLSRFAGATLSSVATTITTGVLSSSEEPLPVSMLITMSIVVAIAATTLITMKGVNTSIGVINRRGSSEEENVTLSRVLRLGELHGLTGREQEILYLIAQKKSVDAIAGEMLIAHGTVKAHIQHIYQKMGVHKRSELERMLG